MLLCDSKSSTMSHKVDAGVTSEDATTEIEVTATPKSAASHDISLIEDGPEPKRSSATHDIIDEGTNSSISAEEHLFERSKDSFQDTLSCATEMVENGKTSALGGYDSPKDESLAVGASTGETVGFLDIALELREIIYGFFFPRAQTIHLTECVSTKHHKDPKATSYLWSKDATNLMLSCRKVHNETTAFVYRTNTFVFTPWALNYHHNRFALHSNTSLWLSGMRPSTKALVKKLDVYVPRPFLAQSIKTMADGLAYFPEVEITMMPLSTVPVTQQANHRRRFEALCLAVQAARVHVKPISWNDGEDQAVADMFSHLALR